MSFPADTPSAEHLERQARHSRLLGYGQPGVHRAAGAHVVVIGVGGLGAPALQVLAAAGLGKLSFIDDDEVERSNLARQTLFRECDIGRPKIEAAADALRGLGPEVALAPTRVRLDDHNASALVAGADVVVDTTDHWPTRFAVADACRTAGIPLVWGSVLGWDGLMTVFMPGEGNPSIDDLVNREQQLLADGPNCATAGVFAPLVAEIGAAMAGETLRLVSGAGAVLVGTVRAWNGRTGHIRELPLAPIAPPEPATATTTTTTDSATATGSDSDSDSAPTRTNSEPSPSIRTDELILDVRPASHPDLELNHKYVHLPLETIAEHVAHGRIDLLPLDEPLVIACALGPRARYAAELLDNAGARTVRTLPGGIPALASLATPNTVTPNPPDAAALTPKEPS